MIVGLTGPAGAGKNLTADVIGELADGYDLPATTHVALAGPLKACAAATLGITVGELERLKLSKRKAITIRAGFLSRRRMSMREYLQRLGTEGGRGVFGDMFWIDQTLPLDLDHREELVLVTDVRFLNEAERITDLGGIVLRVQGPTIVDGKERAHDSEKLAWAKHLPVVDNRVRDDCLVSLINATNKMMPAIAQLFFKELCLPLEETGTDLP